MRKQTHPDVWRLRVTVDAPYVEAFDEALGLYADAVTMFMDDLSGRSDGEGDWHVEGISRFAPDRAAIVAQVTATALAVGIAPPELSIEKIAGTDWVAANLRDFPPIDAGRFFVHGSHWQGGVPTGRIGLLMDAGTAFGSGEHATTYGCLRALSDLVKRRRRIAGSLLDLGCGSGILAIAMAKVWGRSAQATDIDPPSVAVAAKNARLNGVGDRVHVAVSDGWKAPVLARNAPYAVVMANILARPLCRFAPALGRALAPGGVAILSGLLETQERMVMAAHQRQGLRLIRRYRINGWTTLVMGRR